MNLKNVLLVALFAWLCCLVFNYYIQQSAYTKNTGFFLVDKNARVVEIAAQACDNDAGEYSNLHTMLPFFPGGDSKLDGKPGTIPLNPFTGKTGVVETSQIQLADMQNKSSFQLGQVYYVIQDKGASFNIVAAYPSNENKVELLRRSSQ